MGRENNSVRAKVTNDVGRGSIERGSGQAGREGEEGGLTPVGGEVGRTGHVGTDMAAHTGSKGSSGTVKDMGGVGSYGMKDGEHRDFFKDKH